MIIITSLGRTGTNYFYTLFEEMIDDCSSFHEPDVFHARLDEGFQDFLIASKIKLAKVGWKYLLIQKVLGNFSLVKVSDSRLRGALTYENSIKILIEQRSDFILNNQETTYMESSFCYYGLIDLLPKVFANHRIAYIVRDGRDWVRSFHNWGKIYAKNRLRRLIGHTWPRADQYPDDPYYGTWNDMSRFERLCWAWNKLNRYALESIPQNPDAELFRFEDLFSSEDKYDRLAELMSFLLAVHDGETIPNLHGKLEVKVQESANRFPNWLEWSSREKNLFIEHCGELMTKLSYDI